MHNRTPTAGLLTVLAAVNFLACPVPARAAPTAAETAAPVGGQFKLTDQNGHTARDTDLRGKVSLVFFGYTHCPDVCPITVANITQALVLLGDRANQVAPVFITVDPERDTPKVIKAYLAHFDSRFIGLTGSKKDIATVAAAYKAYYSAAPASDQHAHGGHHENGDNAQYRVDHSSFVYLLGPDGSYRSHLAYNEAPTALAEAVRVLLPRP